MNLTIDHEQLLDSLTIGIIVFNNEFKIEYANQTCINWLGLTSDLETSNLITDPFWTIVDKHGDLLATEEFPAVVVARTQKPLCNYEIGVLNHTTNVYSWFLCNAYIEKSTKTQLDNYVLTFTNISDQKEIIPFKDIVAKANDAVIISQAVDTKGAGPEIVYVNEAFSKLTGYSSTEVIGKTPSILSGEKTSPITTKKIMDHLTQFLPVREEVINYKKDGKPYWVDLNIVPLKNSKGIVTHYASIERDITEIKDKTLNLEKLAKTDTLTEALNRRGLNSDGCKAIESAYESGRSFIVAMMDIDHFKTINDTFGHDVGDVVLKHLTDLLKENLRARDIVARIGGEEFVIILEGDPPPILIKKVEFLRQIIEDSAFSVSSDIEFKLTCSFGIAQSDFTTRTINELLKQADIALYKSKSNGRNQVTVYSPS
ncbi:sensor domain-containing diguanylate cyclase [Psychrosphaera haliotis]|uniref:Diguanylate cyclase n=1 Tax=Psychrosphaera haliotis TaxID=555083 RepID=A0A6N8F996_9GAMM|nr:sensor domain-containing diguanylate cyclase [Psychrosphaera haliotis]MUH72828.1 diguanylate cyclase [Psychrosphaera haliotis]